MTFLKLVLYTVPVLELTNFHTTSVIYAETGSGFALSTMLNINMTIGMCLHVDSTCLFCC